MVISLRLSETQERLLGHLAKQQATSRSELIRRALEEFVRHHLREGSVRPYEALARWIGCAHSGRGDLSAKAHRQFRHALHAAAPRAR